MHGSDQTGSCNLATTAAAVLARVREAKPRVHCITNTIAQNFTANMLLAVGAIPSMTIAPNEVAHFVKTSDALVINLGGFDSERRIATDLAVERALDDGIPWLLDPVFIDRSELRAEYARSLVAKTPHTVRLNRAEFSALFGKDAEPDNEIVAQSARDAITTIGLTGAIDLVTDGVGFIEIKNGHPMMDRVTAMGCAVTAVVGACLAVESDPLLATASGLLLAGVAGEMAGDRSKGPGSFAVEVLDAFSALDLDIISRLARVE